MVSVLAAQKRRQTPARTGFSQSGVADIPHCGEPLTWETLGEHGYSKDYRNKPTAELTMPIAAPQTAGFGGPLRQGIKTRAAGQKIQPENRERTHAVDTPAASGFDRLAPKLPHSSRPAPPGSKPLAAGPPSRARARNEGKMVNAASPA